MSNPIVEDWAIREKYEFASQVLQRTANFINSLELQVTEHYNEIETQLEFLARKITFLESQAKLENLKEPQDFGTGKVKTEETPNFALKKAAFDNNGSQPGSRTGTLKKGGFNKGSLKDLNGGQIPPPSFENVPPAFAQPSFSNFGPPSFGGPPAPPSFDNFGGPPAPPSFDNFEGPPAPPMFNSFGGPPAPPSFDNLGGPPAPPNFDSFGGPPAPPSFDNFAQAPASFSNTMPPPPPPFGR